MKRFRNILPVRDFDTKQRMAVDRAVALAKQNAAWLTVFTVVRELPADARMAIMVVPPRELLERVIDHRREQVEAPVAGIGRQGVE